MSGSARIHPLHGNQMRAVEPEETVWLSASAGTGKTQVLSSRVLRLLLQRGVEPSQILCLTFTKAGATEMATRINGTLAEWVRLPETELAMRLEAIGASSDPATRARARTLFASVLDCPGGGLRIDTIHAFSQWLLSAFPQEAGLVPGSRPMEDRERVLLARQVLADMLVSAEREPLADPQLLSAVEDLSLRMGPEAVEGYLLRCAEARDAWFGPGAWQEPMRLRVLQLLGLPSDAEESHAARLCGDDVFDVASLRECLDTHSAWDSATGRGCAAAIADWLGKKGAARAGLIDDLHAALFTKGTGAPKQLNNVLKRDPGYEAKIGRVAECIARVREFRTLLALAERLIPALRLGRAFAIAWDEAKQREGLIDFDDQIRRAAELLGQSTLADWIRYKLDRRFDHILVDEAQDTNAAQWRIIDALTGEFFSGEGQRDDIMRTLFVVGDYKQAIFRFQGTSPENFQRARERVRRQLAGVAGNVVEWPSAREPRPLREYGLDRSFRTAQPVLDFVDTAIGRIGHASFGLAEAPERHRGDETRPGYVALWRPVGAEADIGDGDEQDEGAETWLSNADRLLAEKIAQQVKAWTDPAGPGYRLVKGGDRRANAGDVMVLVRKRRELAGLIVARLHANGVPVAGVDRLRLGAPLAVKDLLAALRFAAQPLDDLTLANLLVSPLVGWSQEQLLQHGYRRGGVRLWEHLRRASHPDVAAVLGQLGELLRLADFDPPQMLLQWLLSGPWEGRRRLVARLGSEANDPIDELVNAAYAYAATATPSLVGFLNWFDAGEGELKREAGAGSNQVRVMTVHGSKGLQAPIVILADATGDPGAGRGSPLDLSDPLAPEERRIPLPALRKDERVGRIAEEFATAQDAEAQEHWRLLYVAMTRAEEALFIGGALSARDKGTPAEESWYAKLQQLFPANGWLADPIWDARLDWSVPPDPIATDGIVKELALPEPLPPVLTREPPAEPRPARPLSPSSLGEEFAPDPPYPAGAGRLAARRGTLIHKLLERLPDMAREQQEDAAARWLSRHASEFSSAEHDEMVAGALAVVHDPRWADLFAPGSLAEVPIAARVGNQVVAGTIDRLVIEEQRIRIVDYKTSRLPPGGIEDVPPAILRQMAAYAAALEAAYPGRCVEAALLYTAVPRLIPIPAPILHKHKQALAQAQ